MSRFIPALAVALAASLNLAATADAGTPRDARGFVDQVGVNVHLYYGDTAYGNYRMVKQRLRELGVRHVRDVSDPDHRQWFYDRVNDLSSNGIKSTLVACPLGNGGWTVGYDQTLYDLKNKVRGALDGVEGVNEPDQAPYANRYVQARDCEFWLNRQSKDGTYGKPLGVPVLGPALAFSSNSPLLGNIGDRADQAAFHPYPGGHPPSGRGYTLASQRSDTLRTEFPGRSVSIQATETGYHDAVNCSGCGHKPTSQRAAAIYMPRLWLEYEQAGVRRAFSYELVDQFPDAGRSDPEKNFGLFENDWSYKPVASALKNMIGFLDSPSASPRTPFSYSLSNTADPDGTGPRGAVKDMLFQKADGSWWLALWQDSSAWDPDARQDIDNQATTVRVSLERTMNVVGYRPTQSTGSVGSVRAQSFSAGVDDDVLLVKLTD